MATSSGRRRESSSSERQEKGASRVRERGVDPIAILQPPHMQKQYQRQHQHQNPNQEVLLPSQEQKRSSRTMSRDRDRDVPRGRDRSPVRQSRSPYRTASPPPRSTSPPPKRSSSVKREVFDPLATPRSARDPSPKRTVHRPVSPKRPSTRDPPLSGYRGTSNPPQTRSTSNPHQNHNQGRSSSNPHQYRSISNQNATSRNYNNSNNVATTPNKTHNRSASAGAVAGQAKTYKPPAMKGRMRTQTPPQASRESSNISHLTPPERVYLTRSPESSATSHLTFETESVKEDHEEDDDDTESSTQYHRMDAPSSTSEEIKATSPKHREKLSRWYEQRFPVLSKSNSHLGNQSGVSSDDEERPATPSALHDGLLDDDDFLKTRQSIAFMAISVTAAQLLILMLQLAMCGLAPFDINPMIGPMPSAFSEWGGKNAYLMLRDNQWWRLITPSFLHVGVIHLLVNAFCQLEAIALFEREWGSLRWLVIYLVSGVGCNAFASYFDPDTISVGSSGTLMGIYGAKLAQVCSHSFFDVSFKEDLSIRLDQLSSVLCGLTLVTILSSFTYIDWSGQAGGFLTGFLCGMFMFGCIIRGCCSWFWWNTIGLLGLIASLASVLYLFVTTSQPMEDIADACEYFRSLFPENYQCGCMWQ